MFFSSIIGLYIVGNLYILYKALNAISARSILARILFAILYICGASSLIIARTFRHSFPAEVLSVCSYVGYFWLIFTLYMVLALLAFDLFSLFIRRKVPFRFVLSLFITVGIMAYGHYKYLNPDVRVLNLTIDKPAKVASLKVVGFSDSHLGKDTDKKKLANFVRLINEQNPDLILIAGDLIDNSIAPVNEQRMDEELSQLKAPLGIFMVTGNHDYFGGVKNVQTFLKKTPIKLLDDEVVTLPNGIQIVGRNDSRGGNRYPLEVIMKEADQAKPIILLDHQPNELDDAVRHGVDLQFSGHTHNGQVWPMTYVVKYMHDLSYGYEQRGGTHFYVSSGISLWGPPFRIGTDSEIVVFNLTFKK